MLDRLGMSRRPFGKIAVGSLMVLVLISCSGCLGGPSMLSREIDDWLNAKYVSSPWGYGNVLVGALVSLWSWVTLVIDGVFNVYYFWSEDAWPVGRGAGTPFTHANPPTAPVKK